MVKLKPLIYISLLNFSMFALVQCGEGLETETSISIHYEDQSDSTQYYSYKIIFPDTLTEPKLARALKTFATAARDSFFAKMPEDRSEIQRPWQLIVKFDENNSARFISYQAIHYHYMDGARGLQTLETFVFDKKKGQLIQLRDLFKDSTVLEPISRHTRNKVAERFYDANSFQNLKSSAIDWIREGTAPEFKNYSTYVPFGETDEGIIGILVRFPPYQVAPYSAGTLGVLIPAWIFHDYLKPEYKKVFVNI